MIVKCVYDETPCTPLSWAPDHTFLIWLGSGKGEGISSSVCYLIFISYSSRVLQGRRAEDADITLAKVVAVCVVLTLGEDPLGMQY